MNNKNNNEIHLAKSPDLSTKISATNVKLQDKIHGLSKSLKYLQQSTFIAIMLSVIFSITKNPLYLILIGILGAAILFHEWLQNYSKQKKERLIRSQLNNKFCVECNSNVSIKVFYVNLINSFIVEEICNCSESKAYTYIDTSIIKNIQEDQ